MEFTDYTGREFCSKACQEGAKESRVCRVCGIEKPLDADHFRRATNTWSGGLWWARDCNECHNALVKRNRDGRMAETPDEVRAYARLKYARRPELYRAYVHRRAAWKRASITEPVNLEAIMVEHGMVCHICGWDIPSVDVLDFDHVHPLARGGTHTADNIAPAHSTCNRWKGARLMGELDLDGRRELMAQKLGLSSEAA